MAEEVTTIIEAAALLGVNRKTMGELVNKLGIETVPVPRNGNARGLTSAHLDLIRERLTPPRPRRRKAKAHASA